MFILSLGPLICNFFNYTFSHYQLRLTKLSKILQAPAYHKLFIWDLFLLIYTSYSILITPPPAFSIVNFFLLSTINNFFLSSYYFALNPPNFYNISSLTLELSKRLYLQISLFYRLSGKNFSHTLLLLDAVEQGKVFEASLFYTRDKRDKVKGTDQQLYMNNSSLSPASSLT